MRGTWRRWVAGAAVAVTVLGTAVVLAPPASAATSIVTNCELTAVPGSLACGDRVRPGEPGDDIIIFGGVAIPAPSCCRAASRRWYLHAAALGAENVTIHGGGADRAFDATGEGSPASPDSPSPTGRSPVGGGGGVYAGDTSLTLVDMVFVDNASVHRMGRAVAAAVGPLTINGQHLPRQHELVPGVVRCRSPALVLQVKSASRSPTTSPSRPWVRVRAVPVPVRHHSERDEHLVREQPAAVDSVAAPSRRRARSLTIDGFVFMCGAREGQRRCDPRTGRFDPRHQRQLLHQGPAFGYGGAISAETGTDVPIRRTTLSQSEAGNGVAPSVTAK